MYGTISTRPSAGFRAPRLTWRGALRRLMALDTLFRERHDLAAMDERTLRDIGLTRSDLDGALRRRDEHLRLILLRGGDQFQR